MLKKFQKPDSDAVYYINNGRWRPPLADIDDQTVAAGFFDKLARYAAGKLMTAGIALDVKLMPITFSRFMTEEHAVFVGLGVSFGRGYNPTSGEGKPNRLFFTIVAEPQPQTAECLATVSNFEAEYGGYAVSMGWQLDLIVSKEVNDLCSGGEAIKCAEGFHNDVTAAAKKASRAWDHEWKTSSAVVPLSGGYDPVTGAVSDVLCDYIYDAATQIFDWSDDESEED
jgi:hypothetical protein